MNTEFKGLCQRCDWWANFLETGMRPRYECGNVVHKCRKCEGSGYTDDKKCKICNGTGYVLHTKHSCYMFKPVRPLVLAKDENDNRPQFAGTMISARSHGVEIPECELKLHESDNGNTIYWKPKE